jgi:20S proteasome alpha/beta subunit
MTLTAVLVGHDGMVAASDSRGTFGDPRGVTAQNDAMTKVFALTPHVVVALAGSAELGVRIIDEVQEQLRQAPTDGVSAVMDLVRERTRQRYAEWFPGWQIQQSAMPAPPVRPDLAIIVAGYDLPAGAPPDSKVFQLLAPYDFAPMRSATGFALQGVAQYALYILNRLFQPDASIDELKALAAYVITETASQDGKVGGPVQMATVTPDAGCTILDPVATQEIVDANVVRSDQLRSSFFAAASGSRRSGTGRP